MKNGGLVKDIALLLFGYDLWGLEKEFFLETFYISFSI